MRSKPPPTCVVRLQRMIPTAAEDVQARIQESITGLQHVPAYHPPRTVGASFPFDRGAAMRLRAIVSQIQCRLCATALSLAVIQLSMGPTLAAAAQSQNDLPSPGSLGTPQSPIKHVIVIIGENRSFDHVFATYQPTAIKGRPQEVLNLLSEGIVNLKGTTAVPGPNWQRAVQKQVASQESAFLLSPPSTDYKVLPNPLAGGPSGQFANLTGFCTSVAACTALAEEVETGLPNASYYASLASGGTGLTSGTPDTRIQWDGHSVQDNNLLPGPFQLTSAALAYTAYAASPVHRFYQMQQAAQLPAPRVELAQPLRL